jgi:hypothetical protein
MNRDEYVVELLTDWLKDQPTRAPDVLMDSLRSDLRTTAQRRSRWRRPIGATPALGMVVRLAAAAAVAFLVVLLVADLLLPAVGPAVPPSPSPSASPTATPCPTPVRSASPSPGGSSTSPAPESDWPGPLREEPPCGSPDALVIAVGETTTTFDDPAADAGVDAPDEIDIDELQIATERDVAEPGLPNGITIVAAEPINFETAPDSPRLGYGVVLDLDGDGIADQRIGIENALFAETFRTWLTDLATGQTATFDGSGSESGLSVDANVTGEGTIMVRLSPIGQQTPAVKAIRFYAWASAIDEGGQISTDFAPDDGWIQTYGAPTSSPSTEIPTASP